uniref:Uncharacterized protein n=1 Tax=Anguilla anguilla TaxID=7936 RepID=A0A0E9R6C6_ANGAN
MGREILGKMNSSLKAGSDKGGILCFPSDSTKRYKDLSKSMPGDQIAKMKNEF